MGKYTPLADHLAASGRVTVRLSFDAIERILGAPLPASATAHQAWWANEAEPTRHVHKVAWMSVGYEVGEVSRPGRWVRFRRR